jgi:transposase-like protein
MPEGRGLPKGFFAPMFERMLKGLSYDQLLELGNEVVAELKATGSSKTLDRPSSSAGRRIACPGCGFDAVERHGRRKKGPRRRRCLTCGKAFAAATGTALSWMKAPLLKWLGFIRREAEQTALKAESSRLGVNIQTAFCLRHRSIAAALGFSKGKAFRGTVRYDGIFFRENEKGGGRYGRRIARKARHSGSEATHGTARDCVLLVMDSFDDVELLVCDGSRCSAAELEGFYGRSRDVRKIVTDGCREYVNTSRRWRFRHEEWASPLCGTPQYQEAMGPLNDMCSAIKGHMQRYRGVASRYLQGYLDLRAFMRNASYTKEGKDVCLKDIHAIEKMAFRPVFA